ASIAAPPSSPAVVPPPQRQVTAEPDRPAPGTARSDEERLRGETMFARGERELSIGNLAPARQILVRAAQAGLARGALLLASTYDANEFARLRIVGAQANSSLARKWYTRASELGASEADERLLALVP